MFFGTGGPLVLLGVLRVVGQHRRLVFTHWDSFVFLIINFFG